MLDRLAHVRTVRGFRRGLNQLSRARRRTTSPTMISVGPCSAARVGEPGSVRSVPVTTRCVAKRALLHDRRRA